MKKYFPWLLTGLLVLWIVSAMRPPRSKTEFNTPDFGRLPVLLNGRVQPLDSVGQNALLQIRGQHSVPLQGNDSKGNWGDFLELRQKADAGQLEERKWYQFSKHPKRLKSTEWLLEVMLLPEQADDRYIFLIHHPELLGELKLDGKGVDKSGLKYFTFNELREHYPVIQQQAERASAIDSQARTPFEKSVVKLHFAMGIYQRLKNSLKPERVNDFVATLDEYEKSIPAGVKAVRDREAGKEFSQADFDRLVNVMEQLDIVARVAYPLLMPPLTPDHSRDAWVNMGGSLMESVRTAELHPAAKLYARMSTAYRNNQPAEFNKALGEYQQWLAQNKFQPEIQKGQREFFYNYFAPFYKCIVLYVLAFFLALASWFNWSGALNRAAYLTLWLTFIVHTAGLIFRMVLEGRPPVTNLYSSAIFVGWGIVVLGLILERLYRNGIGSVVSGLSGFITLIIAHNLSLDGDTMEMMRAVLDTNFWLATHVVIITIGYSATFLAGLLAIVYILRGVFTRSLTPDMAKALNRMVYCVVCFGTLFSFVGTILGGIWADQSWGRFWGWDPKENGALLIVLWNAIILHARWGGLVRERGLMVLTIFGNIVTSFSWFGVNMLGIGLHSYGFMDAAFKWLMLFSVSQLMFMGLGMLPERLWASFQSSPPAGGQPTGTSKPGSAAAGA
jgi:ABC-type transport system involved in cytochrome c biogenesis permease subunit